MDEWPVCGSCVAEFDWRVEVRFGPLAMMVTRLHKARRCSWVTKSGDLTAVALRIDDLDSEIERLRNSGVEIPDGECIESFDSRHLSAFTDPAGNTVDLLDGA